MTASAASILHTVSYASFRDSMIKRLTIKSFKDVTLKLGPLNIFIGINAGRKSNFFDALRVLQGIGYGLSLAQSA